MPQIKPAEPAVITLRFIMISSIGHEVIFSKEEVERISLICRKLNKTIYKKLQPFLEQCLYEYSKNGQNLNNRNRIAQ